MLIVIADIRYKMARVFFNKLITKILNLMFVR
jgi:hypothetical protein